MDFAGKWLRGSAESEIAAFVVVFLSVEVFALPLGWLNAGRTTFWPTATAMAFWIGAGVVNLAIYELATRAAYWVLRPWHPPLITVLVSGPLLGTPFLEIGKHIYVHAFQTAFVGAHLWQPLPSTSILVTPRQLLNIVLWVAINGVLVRFHGLQRFGYVRSAGSVPGSASRAPSEIVPADAPCSKSVPDSAGQGYPAFMSRIRKPIGSICAMAAEEHYVRVIGEEGEDLILYRISDAVAEIGNHIPGARVHRSYWVASSAVVGNERSRSGHVLTLRNGMRVPVSRSFRAAALEARLLEASARYTVVAAG